MVYQFENLGGFEPVYLRQIQKPKIPISRNVIKRRKCPESKSKILVFRFEIYLFGSKIVMRVMNIVIFGALYIQYEFT